MNADPPPEPVSPFPLPPTPRPDDTPERLPPPAGPLPHPPPLG